MKETPITVKLTLVGGKHITNAHAHLVRMEKTKPGCNVRGCPRIPNPETYMEVYRVEKDFWDEWGADGKKTGRKRKGYSFVEVSHRMGGFGGVQSSVKKLIKAACFGIFGMNDHRIIFEGGDQ